MAVRALPLALAAALLAAPVSATLAPGPFSLADHVAGALGLAHPGAPHGPAPGLRASVEAWDARLGVERAAGELDVLDALDPATAGPVASLLRALTEAADARDAAYAGVRDEDLLRWLGSEDPAALAVVAGVDTALLRGATARLAAAVDAALPALRAQAGALPAPPPDAPRTPPLVNLAPVLVLDPVGVDNVYDKDAVLAIDLGGDDVWGMNAGGSIIALGPVGDSSTYQLFLLGFAVGGEFEDSFVAFTASLLVDLKGNDTYGVYKNPRPGSADANCTPLEPIIRRVVIQGAGSGGIGMLVDAEGDDQYRGKTLAQGHGHLAGVGVLADLAGHDSYKAVRSAQGSGVLDGAGVMVDLAGDDAYQLKAPTGGLFNVDKGFCDKTGRLALGAGVQQSAGHFSDLGGADVYNVTSKQQALGYGEAASWGTFTDTGGAVDAYSGYPGRNNNQVSPAVVGAFVDQ